MYDLLLPLGRKGLRQSDIFNCKFHQQTKAFWGILNSQKLVWFYLLENIFLGDAHKYVWLTSPNRPDFCSKVGVGGLASIKTEK